MYNKGRNPYEQLFSKEKMDMKKYMTFLKDGKRVPPPRGMPPELAKISASCLKRSSERAHMEDVIASLKKYCSKKFR
jgi:hypothetical protein